MLGVHLPIVSRTSIVSPTSTRWASFTTFFTGTRDEPVDSARTTGGIQGTLHP